MTCALAMLGSSIRVTSCHCPPAGSSTDMRYAGSAMASGMAPLDNDFSCGQHRRVMLRHNLALHAVLYSLLHSRL